MYFIFNIIYKKMNMCVKFMHVNIENMYYQTFFAIL